MLIEVSNVPAKTDLFNADGEPVGMLQTEAAAEYLGLSVHTLRKWRRAREHRGPRYFRRGNVVRYRPEDLRRYVAQRLIDPETGGAR